MSILYDAFILAFEAIFWAFWIFMIAFMVLNLGSILDSPYDKGDR